MHVEIAYRKTKITDDQKFFRNKIAELLRLYMLKSGLPKEVEEKTGSTIIATNINLSRSNDPIQDIILIIVMMLNNFKK